jgi:hypothetical protein
MMQSEFELTPPTEKAPWRTVRESSIAVYVEGREWLHRRERETMKTLAWYHNHHQQWPTAAEAYQWQHPEHVPTSAEFKLGVINTRRAIADLQRRGIVESNGTRPCRISKRDTIESWRIIPVGR